MRKPVAVLAALTLVGCASKSTEIAPTYVSPMKYQSFTCQQLAAEATRVSAAATAAAGQQDSQVTKDAVATTVGVLIVWPALFLIQGDKQNVAQLAQLKGEMDAIERPFRRIAEFSSDQRPQRLPTRIKSDLIISDAVRTLPCWR